MSKKRPKPGMEFWICSRCDREVEVRIGYRRPLGTYLEPFLCTREDCEAVGQQILEENIRADEAREAAGHQGIPIAVIEPMDPKSQEVEDIQRAWGVNKIKANRGRRVHVDLDPIELEPNTNQRQMQNLKKRDVARLLSIPGFAGVYHPDEVRFYKNYASENYSREELEARVIAKKYPAVHIDNLWDKIQDLENAIVIRGMELGRVKPKVFTHGEHNQTRGEHDPKMRNAHPLGTSGVRAYEKK